MPPLLLANWREINRGFCALCWIVAVTLAIVIVAHAMSMSSACASRQSARVPSVCGQSAGLPSSAGRAQRRR